MKSNSRRNYYVSYNRANNSSLTCESSKIYCALSSSIFEKPFNLSLCCFIQLLNFIFKQ